MEEARRPSLGSRTVIALGHRTIETISIYGEAKLNELQDGIELIPHRIICNVKLLSDFNMVVIDLPTLDDDKWRVGFRHTAFHRENLLNQWLEESKFRVPLEVVHEGQSFGQIKAILIELLEAVQGKIDLMRDQMDQEERVQIKSVEESGRKALPYTGMQAQYWHTINSVDGVAQGMKEFTHLDSFVPKL